MTQSRSTLLQRIRAQHWPTLFVALSVLPAIHFALKRFGYNRLQRGLIRLSPAPPDAPPHSPAGDILTRNVRAVSVAAQRGPVYGTCLSRSLTLWWLLRWQGIDADLRIGVRRRAGQFEAHAWLEQAGCVINDRPDIAEEFATFDSGPFADGAAPAHVHWN